MTPVLEKNKAAAKPALQPLDPWTLGMTLRAIGADVCRKRIQMGKKVRWYSYVTGIFSINVLAVAIWRFSMYFLRKDFGYGPSMVLYYLNIMLFGFDGSPYSSVGPGVVVAHLVGCTLHAKVGSNCTFFGRNAVGGLGKGPWHGWRGGPILEDNVTLGFGAAVIGPRRIGRNALIGAGSWCFSDVEPGAVMVGSPAKFLRARTEEELAEDAQARGEGR